MTHKFLAAGLFASAALFLAPPTALSQTISGGYSATTATSRPVHELGNAVAKGPDVIHHPFTPSHDPHLISGDAQTAPSSPLTATGGVNFDGMNVSNGGYIPSDNNIAVGPNHIVEVVNSAYAVYSKTGAVLLTPRALGGLWTSLTGSTCSKNSGDTVVQYDRLADRWMITQLGSLSSPYSECVAISKTNDPTTTAYNLYTFNFGANLNDYPKWGVWPTATNGAYLATYNLFSGGSTFIGSEICAYDRTAMLNGAATIGYVCATGITGDSYLPIDLDGPTRPLDGTPGYFMDIFGSNLGVYKMSPNFATSPPSATLSAFSAIPVTGYSQANDSPQPNTTMTLDALSDRAMFRLAFRMFNDHEAVVLNHAVIAGAANSGVRWYELRSPISTSGAFSMFQQGTYAPDGDYRWMGSAAMDQAGDIGLGYSVSSASTFPSVRYTGRIPTDALGTMESEGVIVNGAGSQTGYSRWGDYSSMRIDPSDDCTFWYINEYLPTTSPAGWYTRIGSFKFSNCGGSTGAADFSIGANPVSATVNAGTAAASRISVTAINGYSGTVNLSVSSGCPTNAICSVSPTTATLSTTSTLTVATASNTPAGTYSVTVNGVDSVNSALTHSTTFAVTVRVPDFTIAASPISATINAGQSAQSSISVTAVNGYSGTVNLSASGCPTNANCSFNPTTASPSAGSALTVSTASNTPSGTYTVTVNGVDSLNSALTHTTTFAVTVRVPDFSLTATPASATINAGQSAPSTISVTAINGYSGTVNLSVSSGCPANATCSFNPGTASPGATSTLTVATASNTPAGTYTVTVNGVDTVNSALTHTTTFTATVRVPDFSLTATPTSATINAGQSAPSTISVSAVNGYSGTVNLSVSSGCPANATCSFNPGTASPSATSTLTVATASNTPAGTYTVTVNGVDTVNSALTHTTTFAVTVSAADFSISANPTSFSLLQGASGTSTVSLASISGFNSPVALSVGSTCPAGAICSFSTSSVTPTGSSVLTVAPSTSTPPGTYTVVVTGTGGTRTHSANVSVTVAAGFTLSAPSSLAVSRGAIGTASVAVGVVGTSSTSVTLSVAGVPNAVTATFAPNPVTSGNSSVLTVNAKQGAKKGTYTLTVTGTNGVSTQTTTMTLTIN
jgi:hypothetical protein